MDNEINSIKNWSNKDVDTNILNKFLSLAKETYKSEFTKAHLDEEDATFFAWKQQPLHVYIIRITAPLRMLGFLVFATTTEGSIDHINYFDCIKETDNTQFIQTYSDKDKLKIILKNSKQLKNIVSEDIIGDSIFSIGLSVYPDLWAHEFFSNEYKDAKTNFEKAPIQDIKFNDLGLHSNKFKINEIQEAVNDKQFSIEFNECMDAYEHKYYYPAAAGLGGIMESLLYKTLENYKRTSNRILGSDPTLSDYLGALKRFELIDRRQSNRIRSSFVIRNSISHFNSGFTEVSDIQSMLHGVENIYTTLYLPSLRWKESHPGQQLPEPNHQN